MVQYCAVPHCKNRSGTSHISFHSLPLNPDLRKQWLIKIRRDERKCKTSCHMRVCSAHFLCTDYRTVLSGRHFLKQNAVPSVFAFTSPRKVKPPRRKLTYKLGLQVNHSLLL